MAVENIGYIPINEEHYGVLALEWEQMKNQEKYFHLYENKDAYNQAKNRREEIEVTLCRAGRDLPQFHIYTDEIKKRAGARFVPLSEAQAMGQTGLPEMRTLGDYPQIPYVWVWPVGHPFIRVYHPI